MKTYFIDNAYWIIPTIVAIILAFVPIYFQLFFKAKKTSESAIPEHTISLINAQSSNIDDLKNINRYLFDELQLKKLKEGDTHLSIENIGIEHWVEKILEENLVGNTDVQLEKIVTELLIRVSADETSIDNIYFQLEPLITSPAFDKRINFLLLKLFQDNLLSAQIRKNAALLWMTIHEYESIEVVIADELNSCHGFSTTTNNIIEYCFHLVNIGHKYYSGINSYNSSTKSRITTLFEESIPHLLIEYIQSDNLSIVHSATWALMHVMNAKESNKYGLWKPDLLNLNILHSVFSKTKNVHLIRILLVIFNKCCDKTIAFTENYSYDAAFAIDNNIELINDKYETINKELCISLYGKYLASKDEAKCLIARYLSAYGYWEVSIAQNILNQNVKLGHEFIMSVLLPYVGLSNEKGVISYVAEWLDFNDDVMHFYGLLLQKGLENSSKEIFDVLKDNEHSLTSISQINIDNITEIEVYGKKKKTTTLYKAINLMRPYFAHTLKAKDTTGRWAWYVVLVDPDKQNLFLEVIEGDGTIDLTDYGKVLVCEYGEDFPSNDKVNEMIFKKYG